MQGVPNTPENKLVYNQMIETNMDNHMLNIFQVTSMFESYDETTILPYPLRRFVSV